MFSRYRDISQSSSDALWRHHLGGIYIVHRSRAWGVAHPALTRWGRGGPHALGHCALVESGRYGLLSDTPVSNKFIHIIM